VASSSRLVTGPVGEQQTVTRSTPMATAVRWSLAVIAFAWYTAFSLRAEARHLGGFDLAVFDQAVANLAHFRAPVSAIKGMDLLGDHFHPVIAVAAPFYWIYPHPSTLLTVQAAALAVSVLIVTKAVQQLFGARLGVAVGFAYAISWGLQSALYFGFHEVSLGVPIIAAAVAYCLRRKWGIAAAFAALLLLVKEDLAFTAAAFGIYLCLQKKYRLGVVLVVGSMCWFFAVIEVFIPRLNPYGRYLYWPGSAPLPSTPGQPSFGLDASTLWSWQKLLTLVLVLAPMLFLALRSWLAIVLIPTLGWRFLSANSHYWGTKYHYSEILMPVTFLAGVAGAACIAWPPRLRRNMLRGISVAAVVVGLAIAAGFPFARAIAPGYWTSCARCVAADAALAQIPSGVTVTSDDALLPAVVDRDTAHVLAPGLLDGRGRPLRTDYVLIDVEHATQFSQPGWLAELQAGVLSTDYAPVFSRDGYVVYRKR